MLNEIEIKDTCPITIYVLFAQFTAVSEIPSTEMNSKEVDVWVMKSTKYFYNTTQFEFKVRNGFSFETDMQNI